MILLSTLIGHDAMNVSTATTTGAVTGIGLAANRIVSVGIGKESIDATAVRGFDGDAVTYETTTATAGAGAEAPPVLPPPLDPRGSKVLDQHGDRLGTIADLTITDEGVVDTILLDDGHALPGSRLLVIGSYAAIVSIEPPRS